MADRNVAEPHATSGRRPNVAVLAVVVLVIVSAVGVRWSNAGRADITVALFGVVVDDEPLLLPDDSSVPLVVDFAPGRSLDLTVGFVGLRDDQLKALRVPLAPATLAAVRQIIPEPDLNDGLIRFQVQLETTDCSEYQAGSGVVIDQVELTYRAAGRTRTSTVILPYSIEILVPENAEGCGSGTK